MVYCSGIVAVAAAVMSCSMCALLKSLLARTRACFTVVLVSVYVAVF